MRKYFREIITVTNRTLRIAKIVPTASNAFERPFAFNRSNKLLVTNGIFTFLNEKSFCFQDFEEISFLPVLILDLNPRVALFENIGQDSLHYVRVIIVSVPKQIN